MTLAQRLLAAIGVVTITATFTVGYGVREAWRSAEEERFHEQFNAAVVRLRRELETELTELPDLLESFCKGDPVLDAAVIELRHDRLDPAKRLSLQLRIRYLWHLLGPSALGLDELLLLTQSGEVLGAGHTESLIGTRVESLVARLAKPGPTAKLRADKPVALEAHCALREKEFALVLYGARHFDRMLEAVGTAHGLELSLYQPDPSRDRMIATVTLQELQGVTLVATQSRVPLRRALRKLDVTVAAIGGSVFSLALLFALLLARGLARPIVALSEQARHVVSGDPQPVEARGGRELEELAASFNRAIQDLTALRKRLAATERVAARREIARQVAHEIKNPLAPIRAAVETLRRLRARSDPAFDEYFDEASRTVLDEVARIARIVQEFTEFARLPAPSPAPLDLSQTVRDVVRLHAAGGIPIHFESATVPTVYADREQIVQVLTNLLQNATDAVRAVQAPEVRVVLAQLDAERVSLRVEDNGPGVAPTMRDRLFEPYATDKEHGTGLGLSIAQRIVIEHGGDIAYDDAHGGGARFNVTLPITGPPPASARDSARGSIRPSSP